MNKIVTSLFLVLFFGLVLGQKNTQPNKYSSNQINWIIVGFLVGIPVTMCFCVCCIAWLCRIYQSRQNRESYSVGNPASPNYGIIEESFIAKTSAPYYIPPPPPPLTLEAENLSESSQYSYVVTNSLQNSYQDVYGESQV